jgi:peroxiredoxin
MKRVLRRIAIVAAVILVGALGVFVGMALRARVPGRQATMVDARVPMSLLKEGNAFPDVVVAGEDGAALRTADLLADGGVVLFLDLACEPCVDAALRWQRAADEGVVSPDRLFGMTFHSRDATREFKDAHGLRFPLLRDSLLVFHSRYDVDRFPLQVVVGASGVMREVTYDTVSPLDVEALAHDLVH